jgi:hypothetical protein
MASFKAQPITFGILIATVGTFIVALALAPQ